MKRVIVLLCIIIPISTWAQLTEVLSIEQKPLSGLEFIENITEITNGNIIAVGTTESFGQKKDGLLQILDPRRQQIIFAKHYGGRFDEGFHAVTQTNNGRLIIAGYTGTNTKGKRDAWLVCTDEEGQIIWSHNEGTSGNDAFLDISYNPLKNRVTAVGYKNDQAANDIWVVQYDLSKEGPQLIKEASFGNKSYEQVRAIAQNTQGEIVITGNSIRPKGRVYLMKINQDLEEVLLQTFGGNEEKVEDVIVTSTGDYVLAGSTITRSDGENVWAAKIDKYGNELWSEDYGGDDHDAAMGVTEALDGGYYFTGRTLSHRDNARAEKIYLLKVDKGGERAFAKSYGGSKDDIGKAVLQMKSGTILIAADTESDKAQRKDAIFKGFTFNEDLLAIEAGMRSSINLRIDKNIISTTADGVWRPNDQASVAVTIHNESAIALPNVSVRVGKKGGAKGLDIWQTNYIGKMEPNSSKVVHMPAEAAANLQGGSHDFEMAILSGNTRLESTEFSLKSNSPKPAKLDLFDYKAELVGTTRGATPTVKLTLTFVNQGDFSTKSAYVKAQPPNGIQTIAASSRLTIGNVAPTSRRQIVYTFQASPDYMRYRRDATIAFQVFNNNQAAPQPIRVTIDNLENPTVSGGGDSGPTMLWVDPGPSDDGVKYTTSDPNAKIRLAIRSKQKLTTQDIKVYVNKNVVEGNKNFGEEELKAPVDNFSDALYARKIELNEGLNEVFIQIGDKPSRKIYIEYLPRSRNLHVLAIGPSHPDLKYTSKDARDFAEAFKKQSGKLFNETFITELSTPENTTRDRIAMAVLDFENKFRNQEILPNDVLIVFISSHGVIGSGDRYKIIPSGFNPAYGDRFTVDYKDDILDPLSNIDCKKLIFIDACHSGAASSKGAMKDQRRSEMIFRLNAQSPGLSSITSCKSTELSYEDDAWGNGAFTEAIIEGLNNTPIQGPDGISYRASIDDDFITIGELYNFVRRRVLNLVKTYKPNAPTNQTPDLIGGQGDELDEALPIFEVQNN